MSTVFVDDSECTESSSVDWFKSPGRSELKDDFSEKLAAEYGITYKIADCREEREAAFRLVYDSYTKAGLTVPNDFQMRVTPYHLLPTTEVFIAVGHQEVIATLSLIGDGDLGVPMESIYAAEIDSLRRQGIRFGEVSSLADRRKSTRRFMPVLFNLTRLMAQHARYTGMDQLLIAVHPKHERFYKRFMGFERFGQQRVYPWVRGNPAVAACLDFSNAARQREATYARYFREAIPENELCPRAMSDEERQYFVPVAESTATCSFVSVA